MTAKDKKAPGRQALRELEGMIVDKKKLKALSTIDRCLGGIEGVLLGIGDTCAEDAISGYLEKITEAVEVLRDAT